MQKFRGALIFVLLIACSAFEGCATAALKQPGASGDDAGPFENGPPAGALGTSGTSGDGGSRDRPAAPVPVSANVTIQVQPSDSGAQVERVIRAAKKSVHMTMYLLTDTSIIDALGDLQAAGKDVKVVLNKTFPPNGGDNTSAFRKLQDRGVAVVYAPSAYTFTHAKTVVIDGERALIMTMNLTNSSARENREFIATDADPGDVAECETLFDADFKGNAVSVNGNLVVSPQTATPVDPRMRLVALIDSARTTLDVEVQSLSDDGLTDAIVRAHKANVAVRVVLSAAREGTTGQQDAATKLRAAGVPLKGVVAPYIHSKSVVVDGHVLFVGSQNFTPTALFQNREVGVVTDSLVEASKVRDVIAADFAAGASF